MFDKHFIGQNAAGITAAPQFAPISKVVLLVDDERSYVAGDNTGREMELTCPYGSQDMANDLLTRLQGYAYRPMTAQDALLDPAAELGDGVTVGGIYTVLAEMDTMFDMHCAADIAAPGEDEVDSEYKYQTPEKRFERQLAATRSLITKTAEEVGLKVEGLEGQYTALSVTLNDVTVTDDEGTTRIKGSSIETDTLYVQAAHITGKLKASQINATNLEVDAANITGTLVAQELIGETVVLRDQNEEPAGSLTIGDSSSADYRVELRSGGALYLGADNGAVWLEAEESALGVSSSGITAVGDLLPESDKTYDLGAGGLSWDNVYAVTCKATSSDANKKNSIEDLPDKYVAMFDLLRPVRFKYNSGTSGRYHAGYIAQEVKTAMDAVNLDASEFGGWIMDKDRDGNEIYMLRYGEFDAIRDAKIKQLEARVARLEAGYGI